MPRHVLDAELAAVVSDTAYNPTSWDGDTTHAPSKNVLRDKIEALTTPPAGPAGGALAGTYPNPTLAALGIVNADISASAAIGRAKLAAPEGITVVNAVGGAAPAFLTGWSNLGSGFQVAGFWYDEASRMVHLRGVCAADAGSTGAVFVLPVGYRPLAHEQFNVATYVGGVSYTTLTVYSTGAVSVSTAGALTVCNLVGAWRVDA